MSNSQIQGRFGGRFTGRYNNQGRDLSRQGYQRSNSLFLGNKNSYGILYSSGQSSLDFSISKAPFLARFAEKGLSHFIDREGLLQDAITGLFPEIIQPIGLGPNMATEVVSKLVAYDLMTFQEGDRLDRMRFGVLNGGIPVGVAPIVPVIPIAAIPIANAPIGGTPIAGAPIGGAPIGGASF